MFFYSDTEKRPFNPRGMHPKDMDGTRGYLRHYANYLELQFFATSPRTTDHEKRQARLELTICERKLTYWSHHPRYVHAEALRGVDDLKRMWRETR